MKDSRALLRMDIVGLPCTSHALCPNYWPELKFWSTCGHELTLAASTLALYTSYCCLLLHYILYTIYYILYSIYYLLQARRPKRYFASGEMKRPAAKASSSAASASKRKLHSCVVVWVLLSIALCEPWSKLLRRRRLHRDQTCSLLLITGLLGYPLYNEEF